MGILKSFSEFFQGIGQSAIDHWNALSKEGGYEAPDITSDLYKRFDGGLINNDAIYTYMKNKLFAKIDSINNKNFQTSIVRKIPVGDISENIKNDLNVTKDDFLKSQKELRENFIQIRKHRNNLYQSLVSDIIMLRYINLIDMYTKILYKNKDRLLAAIDKYNSTIKRLKELIKEFVRLQTRTAFAGIGNIDASQLIEQFKELLNSMGDFVKEAFNVFVDEDGNIIFQNPFQPNESDPNYGKDYSYYYILKLGDTVHGAIKYEHSETPVDIGKNPPKNLVLDLITDKDFIIADGTETYPIVVRSVEDFCQLKTQFGTQPTNYVLDENSESTIISLRLFEDIDLSGDNIKNATDNEYYSIVKKDSNNVFHFGLFNGKSQTEIEKNIIINIDLNGHRLKIDGASYFGTYNGNDEFSIDETNRVVNISNGFIQFLPELNKDQKFTSVIGVGSSLNKVEFEFVEQSEGDNSSVLDNAGTTTVFIPILPPVFASKEVPSVLGGNKDYVYITMCSESSISDVVFTNNTDVQRYEKEAQINFPRVIISQNGEISNAGYVNVDANSQGTSKNATGNASVKNVHCNNFRIANQMGFFFNIFSITLPLSMTGRISNKSSQAERLSYDEIDISGLEDQTATTIKYDDSTGFGHVNVEQTKAYAIFTADESYRNVETEFYGQFESGYKYVYYPPDEESTDMSNVSEGDMMSAEDVEAMQSPSSAESTESGSSVYEHRYVMFYLDPSLKSAEINIRHRDDISSIPFELSEIAIDLQKYLGSTDSDKSDYTDVVEEIEENKDSLDDLESKEPEPEEVEETLTEVTDSMSELLNSLQNDIIAKHSNDLEKLYYALGSSLRAIVGCIDSARLINSKRKGEDPSYSSIYVDTLWTKASRLSEEITAFMTDKAAGFDNVAENLLQSTVYTNPIGILQLNNKDIGQKIIESQENIIDRISEGVDGLFNTVQGDLEQFLASEDMLNQYMGHFQPYFMNSIPTKDISNSMDKFVDVFTALDSNIIESKKDMGGSGDTYRRFMISASIRKFSDWSKEFEDIVGALPIYNAMLLYLALEIGVMSQGIELPMLNVYEPAGSLKHSFKSETYIKKLINRAILYLSQKGCLVDFLNKRYRDVFESETYLNNNGYVISEFFDIQAVNSELLKYLPSLSKVDVYDVYSTFEKNTFKFSDDLKDNIRLLILKDLVSVPKDRIDLVCRRCAEIITNPKASIRTQYLLESFCEALYIYLIADAAHTDPVMPSETLLYVLEFMMIYGEFSLYDKDEKETTDLVTVDSILDILRPKPSSPTNTVIVDDLLTTTRTPTGTENIKQIFQYSFNQEIQEEVFRKYWIVYEFYFKNMNDGLTYITEGDSRINYLPLKDLISGETFLHKREYYIAAEIDQVKQNDIFRDSYAYLLTCPGPATAVQTKNSNSITVNLPTENNSYQIAEVYYDKDEKIQLVKNNARDYNDSSMWAFTNKTYGGGSSLGKLSFNKSLSEYIKHIDGSNVEKVSLSNIGHLFSTLIVDDPDACIISTWEDLYDKDELFKDMPLDKDGYILDKDGKKVSIEVTDNKGKKMSVWIKPNKENVSDENITNFTIYSADNSSEIDIGTLERPKLTDINPINIDNSAAPIEYHRIVARCLYEGIPIDSLPSAPFLIDKYFITNTDTDRKLLSYSPGNDADGNANYDTLPTLRRSYITKDIFDSEGFTKTSLYYAKKFNRIKMNYQTSNNNLTVDDNMVSYKPSGFIPSNITKIYTIDEGIALIDFEFVSKNIIDKDLYDNIDIKYAESFTLSEIQSINGKVGEIVGRFLGIKDSDKRLYILRDSTMGLPLLGKNFTVEVYPNISCVLLNKKVLISSKPIIVELADKEQMSVRVPQFTINNKAVSYKDLAGMTIFYKDISKNNQLLKFLIKPSLKYSDDLSEYIANVQMLNQA